MGDYRHPSGEFARPTLFSQFRYADYEIDVKRRNSVPGSLYFTFKPCFRPNLNVERKFVNETIFINFVVLISKNYFINVNSIQGSLYFIFKPRFHQNLDVEQKFLNY